MIIAAIKISIIGISIFILIQTIEIQQKLSQIAKILDSEKKIYNVDSKYVIINPCDLFDIRVRDSIENNIK